MGQVASELLVKALGDSGESPGALPPLRWTSRDLGPPRVDLEDKEAVRALLDERA